MKNLIISLVVLLLTQPVLGQSRAESRYFPKTLALSLADSDQVHDRLVLKFTDDSGIRWQAGRLQSQQRLDHKTQRALTELNRWLTTKNYPAPALFTDNQDLLDRKRARVMQQSGQYLADLNAYVSLKIPSRAGFKFKADLSYLNSLPFIQVAYLEAPSYQGLDFDPPIDDIAPVGITPLLVNHQQYFYPAPQGVGIFDAWDHPGGKGVGVKVIVYDNNYRATHEDLPNLFYTTGGNPVDEQHGTAVLGILGAKHNGIGLKGGVYDAQFGFQEAASAVESHADFLLNAADQLNYGDVIVTEVGRKVNALGFECPCNPTQANSVPIEFYPAEYDAISQIVASGISVVETAGNGCVDFDDPVFQGMFDTTINHSGAIWAGASLHDSRTPTCYSNSGERVDLHAWGESVSALLFLRDDEVALFDAGLDRRYGPNFGGTSSAAPIITACVASLQAQSKSAFLGPMSPAEVRDLLVTTGQAQTGELDRPIGPMPDIGDIEF